MCLRAHDWVSRIISLEGRWPECDGLVTLFNSRADNPHSSTLFLDIGANIGSCTMQMLLQTRARVIAFEPNAQNLFYLTRSLKHAARRDPSLAHRVLVLPIGLGEADSSLTVFEEPSNAGNTQLRFSRSSVAGAQDMQNLGAVPVRVLDRLFLSSGATRLSARLAKLDVQGMECAVLRGSRHLLRSGQVEMVVAEAAEGALKTAGCSVDELKSLLRNGGSKWASSAVFDVRRQPSGLDSIHDEGIVGVLRPEWLPTRAARGDEAGSNGVVPSGQGSCLHQLHLIEQASKARCEHGVSFGCLAKHPNTMWVRGCRGVFQCGPAGDGPHGLASLPPPFTCGYPPGQAQYRCMCNASLHGWPLHAMTNGSLASPVWD